MSFVATPSNILNGVSGVGPGGTLNLYGIYRTFTFMKRIAGTFTALTVNYEGSLDGWAWFQLGSDATLNAGPTFVVDRPCAFIRANVATFTGGTSVSVDVAPVA